MSVEENEELLNENIENTYNQLTKVVNAKNDIKNSVSLNTEELTRIETKLEELEEILHKSRIKITSNPILKELNRTSEQHAMKQRKLAESVYSELTDLSSRLDIYEEYYSKLNEVYNQMEKLLASVEQKLEKKINSMYSSRKEWEKRVNELRTNIEKDISIQEQDLKNKIAQLKAESAEQTIFLKSLTDTKEIKQIILEKMKEKNQQYLQILLDLDNVRMNSDEISSLEENQTELNNEIAELIVKSNTLIHKMNDLKTSKTKLQEQLAMQKVLFKKQTCYASIRKLKMNLIEKQKACLKPQESINTRKNSISDKASQIELCALECNKISDEIQAEKQIIERLSKEKQEIFENKKTKEERMVELKEKLTEIIQNKNTDEISISIINEKQTILLEEKSNIEKNLSETIGVIEEMNDQISKIQTEINEKENVAETPSYLEAEKEKELLDTKIRRYVKAIEICKRNRAAAMAKKRNYHNNSFSSDDSMLINSKKNKI